jgi:hypothetical protein
MHYKAKAEKKAAEREGYGSLSANPGIVFIRSL